MRRRLRVVAALVATGVLLATGCGGDGEETDDVGAEPTGMGLASFSVRSEDLPSGYAEASDETGSLSAETCISQTESGGGADIAARLRESGLTACHRSKLRKETEGSTSEIGTASYQARDAASAESLFPEMAAFVKRSFTANLTPTDLPSPGVGEQSEAVEATQTGNPVEAVVVVWRKGAVVSMLFSIHLDPEFDAQNIVDLAKRIDARASV